MRLSSRTGGPNKMDAAFVKASFEIVWGLEDAVFAPTNEVRLSYAGFSSWQTPVFLKRLEQLSIQIVTLVQEAESTLSLPQPNHLNP